MTVARRPAARRLGRYLVGERIGSGGIGDVFVATTEGHDGFSKTVVIKMLRPALADVPELAASLRDEANLARRLSHGNIVQVLDLGDDGGRPYVVLEHVDGASLQTLLDDLDARGERLPLATALWVTGEIAAALDHAHRFTDDTGVPAPVIHRDVKPANVLVSKGGVVKLTDFGIAKATGRQRDTLAGTVKGTPLFLSPEQAAGAEVDARTDVFGLGRVLQLLVLGPPGSPREDAAPGVDDELRAIVARCLADDPVERTPDVDALRESLHAWCARAGVRPTAGPLGDLVRRLRREPPRKPSIALDAALLGEPPPHATTHVAREPGPPATTKIAVAALAFAILLATVWLLAWPAGEGHEEMARERPRPGHAAMREDEGVRPSREAPGLEAGTSGEAPALEPASAGDAFEGTEASGGRPPEGPTTTRAPDPAPRPDRRPPPVQRPKTRLRINLVPYADVILDGRRLGRTPVDLRVASGSGLELVLEHPTIGKKVRVIDLPAHGEVSIETW